MSRQYISSFRPKPSLMPSMAHSSNISSIGRPVTPPFLKNYKKFSQPKINQNKTVTKRITYVDESAVQREVQRNAMHVHLLENALSVLRGKEKRALRELDNEMKKYRKDLENNPVRSFTTDADKDTVKLLPPVENEDVVLKRFGRIKSTIKMKIKKKPGKPSNKTALIKETEIKIEENEIKGPAITREREQPSVTPGQTIFSRPTTAVCSPQLRTVTARSSSSKSCSSFGKKSTSHSQNHFLRSSSTGNVSVKPLPFQSRMNSNVELNTNALDERGVDLPQCVVCSPRRSPSMLSPRPPAERKPKEKHSETPVPENIAKTCGEYLGLFKLITQQHPPSELAHGNINPRGNEQEQSRENSVALVPASSMLRKSGSKSFPKTIRLKDSSTQFEDKYVIEEDLSPSAPREMWPSWFSPNSKPVQTDSPYFPIEHPKKETIERGINTSHIGLDLVETHQYDTYANTKVKPERKDKKLHHSRMLQSLQADEYWNSQRCAGCSSMPDRSFLSTLSSYDSALSGFNNTTPSGRRNNQIFITSTDDSLDEACSCECHDSHQPQSRYNQDTGRNFKEKRHASIPKRCINYEESRLRCRSSQSHRTLCGNCSKIEYPKHGRYVQEVKVSRNHRASKQHVKQTSSSAPRYFREQSRCSSGSSESHLPDSRMCSRPVVIATQTPATWKNDEKQQANNKHSSILKIERCMNKSAQVSFLGQSVAETQTDQQQRLTHDIGIGTNTPLPQTAVSSLKAEATSTETTLVEIANEACYSPQESTPRFTNPIMLELEKQCTPAGTQTSETMNFDTSIRVPSVWRPVYHIPNCKPKSARLVPMQQPNSDNPVFHIELCDISEERTLSSTVTPQKTSGDCSTEENKEEPHVFTFTRPVEAEQKEFNQNNVERNIEEKLNTVADSKSIRPLSRIESDIMADNVFHRETDFIETYAPQHRRKFIPGQFIEPSLKEVNPFQQPKENISISISDGTLLHGEECSDFIAPKSSRSADFANRWRRGVRNRPRRKQVSPVRLSCKSNSSNDSRQTWKWALSDPAKKTSYAHKRHLSSPKLNDISKDVETHYVEDKDGEYLSFRENSLPEPSPPLMKEIDVIALKEEPRKKRLPEHGMRYKVSKNKHSEAPKHNNPTTSDAVQKNDISKKSDKEEAKMESFYNEFLSSFTNFTLGATNQVSELQEIKVSKEEFKRARKANKKAITSDNQAQKGTIVKSLQVFNVETPADVTSGDKLFSHNLNKPHTKPKQDEKSFKAEEEPLEAEVKGKVSDDNSKVAENPNTILLDDDPTKIDINEDVPTISCEIREISNKESLLPRPRKRLIIRK